MEDVAASGFTVVRGDVYDLRGFAEEHGGGRAVIEHARGRDATASFNSNHVFDPKKLLARYHVGRLAK